MPTHKAVIYHNSKCSKSNAALDLLQENGIDVEVIHYLETPLSETEIADLIVRLGIEAKALIRFNEPVTKELGISPDDQRESHEWIHLMVQHPILIERPIVQMNNHAVIGRPLERVLALLQST